MMNENLRNRDAGKEINQTPLEHHTSSGQGLMQQPGAFEQHFSYQNEKLDNSP
jgi:hypothetical protein